MLEKHTTYFLLDHLPLKQNRKYNQALDVNCSNLNRNYLSGVMTSKLQFTK